MSSTLDTLIMYAGKHKAVILDVNHSQKNPKMKAIATVGPHTQQCTDLSPQGHEFLKYRKSLDSMIAASGVEVREPETDISPCGGKNYKST